MKRLLSSISLGIIQVWVGLVGVFGSILLLLWASANHPFLVLGIWLTIVGGILGVLAHRGNQCAIY